MLRTVSDNIKYRAFGQVKQIDYKLPSSQTVAIKMEYDSGLKVSHSEATMPGSTTSFLMKADHTYANDDRTTAKNDLLADRWDSTMKYDFAARMTFNQFGMGPASDPMEPDKRVYEQTITYDAFSNMTTRAGVHWDNSIGMSETYTNGRINAGTTKTMTYDAAGNLTLSKPDVNAAHDFQENTFDAAGRRTLFRSEIKGHGGSYLNYVTETKEEKVFDGDGRPAYSKSGSRGYNLSSPPSGSLTTSLTNFAVYSTVLGQMLTELAPDGSKITTNIYAGGAMIGKQGATYTSGGSTYDNPDLETADPVTGTNAHFTYDPTYGTNAYTKNIEPLGQDVSSTDPVDYGGPPSQALITNTAGGPEWQCAMPWTWKFMPLHCQLKAIESADNFLPWENEVKTSPQKIARGLDAPTNPNIPAGGRNPTLAYGLRSSLKPHYDGSGCPPGTEPMDDANGEMQCVGTGETKVDVHYDDPSTDNLVIRLRSFMNGNSFGKWVDFGSRFESTGSEPPYAPPARPTSICDYVRTDLDNPFSRIGGSLLLLKAAERLIGQDFLADSLKAEVSFMGGSLALQNTRDGDVLINVGGGLDPKGLFVDIPAAAMKDKNLTPSFSFTGQKILARGNLTRPQRLNVFENWSGTAGGGYRFYGGVDVSNLGSKDQTFTINAGTGTGINVAGVAWAKNLFRGCLRW